MYTVNALLDLASLKPCNSKLRRPKTTFNSHSVLAELDEGVLKWSKMAGNSMWRKNWSFLQSIPSNPFSMLNTPPRNAKLPNHPEAAYSAATGNDHPGTHGVWSSTWKPVCAPSSNSFWKFMVNSLGASWRIPSISHGVLILCRLSTSLFSPSFRIWQIRTMTLIPWTHWFCDGFSAMLRGCYLL